MNQNAEQDESTVLDGALRDRLAQSYGNLSRRSFLAGLTRRVIALAGVMVAAEMLPMPARGQEECGRHGWKCGTGNCSASLNGAVQRDKWVQCCNSETDCGKYLRCSFVDICRNSVQYGFFEDSGCEGPNGGMPWCGGMPYQFICTQSSCQPNVYDNIFTCINGFVGAPGNPGASLTTIGQGEGL